MPFAAESNCRSRGTREANCEKIETLFALTILSTFRYPPRVINKKLGILLVLLAAQSLPISSASATDAILPISSVTPGAINPSVTQANIKSTICKSGWTATIRPSSSYTDRLKTQQLFSGAYSFYSDKLLSDYEEDYLISLELGGSPTSPLNLWPEPYAGDSGARVKDVVETKLKTLVCAGRLSLGVAQEAIAQDWYAAYQQYVLGQAVTPKRTITTSVLTPTSVTTPIAIVSSPAPIVTKTIPNLPTPRITTLSTSAFSIYVSDIPGFDFSVMNLKLHLTTAGGTCPSDIAITALPISITCANFPANQISVMDLVATGTYGKTTNTLVFSDFAMANTYTSQQGSPTPTATPTPTPTTVDTPPPTPIITSSAPRTCWVNGYTRKNGTHVKGYYRSC